MNEKNYDELLNIKTTGNQMGFHSSFHYHRYEATPYEALDSLFEMYELNSKHRIVDFGCGKGRLNFYIHYFFQAEVVGVEMSENFFQEAIRNRDQYCKRVKTGKERMHFHFGLAEQYPIELRDNRFYFFNPFSLAIFMKVIRNILLSYELEKRELDVILYYPSEDYIYYLENQTSFELAKEIKLSEKDVSERFLVYRLT
ncbi:methyltransferase [Bacillus sp. 31A1R]|uniref:Methyltransferase n=1 Tax=Robertmurraya mangrovi TaxID=3098077 RepID=A0ABU5J3U5_9BACI|nr:methyltransferase domain-containing protein [Bacillus sp. 31A1R]MDZ5474089.1 methyltransferase [Bacillus sp. 31A1R]